MTSDSRRDPELPADTLVDWYAVLGLAPDAAPEDIRDAWRKLARIWHPDVHAGGRDAAHRFHLIQSAWQILGDPERRRAFDHARASFAARVAPLPSSVVERLVGVRRPEPEIGRNRLYRLTVSVAEVVTGTRRTIGVPADTTCGDCGGSGLGLSARPLLCPSCGGRCFEVTRPVLRAIGEPCARCDATGWVPEPACAACAGSGRVATIMNAEVAIPAGVSEGSSIILGGFGERGRGGATSGDLQVIIGISQDGPWRLVGDDWHGVVAVPFWMALCGGRVTVGTPRGPRIVHLPERTQAGERLCLQGLGVNGRGDGFLDVQLVWPDDLTEAEQTALVSWGKAVDSRRAQAKGSDDE